MNYATETYSSSAIYEWIINYRSNLIAANRLKREYIETIGGGGISQYGLEASLPKAVGETGDPTFREISRLIKQDSMIDRLEHRVRYIQNRWDRITEEHQAIVFNLALNGRSIKSIAEITQQSEPTIRRRLREVSIILMD